MPRIAGKSKLTWASSFPDRATAEASIAMVLDMNREAIRDWLNQPRPGFRLTADAGTEVGYSVRSDGAVVNTSKLRVILRKEDTALGYYIYTAFPNPYGVPDAMTRYLTLDYFFGVYLHEDWPDDYGNEWTALDAFAAEGPPEDPQLFQADVAKLLAEEASEDDLRKLILDGLGCYLDPEADGWKYREWLQALSDHVARAADRPSLLMKGSIRPSERRSP